MHICIDGRSISHPQRGGFKTYIENLVVALAGLPGQDHFTVVYDRPYRFLPLADHPHFHEVVVSAHVAMAGQVFREQIALPARARQSRGEIWHFPYNTAPLRGISAYVLTLHDVTSFTHPARPDWSRPLQGVKELALFYYPRFLVRRAAQGARAIITVSRYARDRIIETLGVPADRVRVTSLAAQALFRPLSEAERGQARQHVRELYGLERPFLLTVASSLLKNPQGVVEAYAGLPEELHHSCDLVVIMAYERARAAVEIIAERLGVAAQVHFLIGLQPEHLLWLYNLANALVYPSITESFGLPAAEAMACGTPVICSNTTAFPELVGAAAITLSPTDTRALVEAMISVLTNPGLAADLRERGLRRSRDFSWQRTAEQTMAVYRLAARAATP